MRYNVIMAKQVELTKSDILHIAKLANLTLSEKEVEKYLGQLSDILSYFEKLNEVDTAKIPETSQVTGLINITREDVIMNDQTIKKGDFYTVKAVFDETQ